MTTATLGTWFSSLGFYGLPRQGKQKVPCLHAVSSVYADDDDDDEEKDHDEA